MRAIYKFPKYWLYIIYYYTTICYSYVKYYRDPKLRYMYKAMLFALTTHHRVRQRYDSYPYFYHINMVTKFALKFSHIMDNNINVILGAIFHDLIEDCRLTYNDVKEKWGVEVADIVFACTELRGKNRSERHGKEYYDLLQTTETGSFVKICDVIANMTQGTITGSGMLTKYRTGYNKFKELLYRDKFKEMFDYIESNLLEDRN